MTLLLLGLSLGSTSAAAGEDPPLQDQDPPQIVWNHGHETEPLPVPFALSGSVTDENPTMAVIRTYDINDVEMDRYILTDELGPNGEFSILVDPRQYPFFEGSTVVALMEARDLYRRSDVY